MCVERVWKIWVRVSTTREPWSLWLRKATSMRTKNELPGGTTLRSFCLWVWVRPGLRPLKSPHGCSVRVWSGCVECLQARSQPLQRVHVNLRNWQKKLVHIEWHSLWDFKSHSVERAMSLSFPEELQICRSVCYHRKQSAHRNHARPNFEQKLLRLTKLKMLWPEHPPQIFTNPRPTLVKGAKLVLRIELTFQIKEVQTWVCVCLQTKCTKLHAPERRYSKFKFDNFIAKSSFCISSSVFFVCLFWCLKKYHLN